MNTNIEKTKTSYHLHPTTLEALTPFHNGTSDYFQPIKYIYLYVYTSLSIFTGYSYTHIRIRS